MYIFEYDEYYRYQDCTYEVVAEGVLPEIDSLQRIPTDRFTLVEAADPVG